MFTRRTWGLLAAAALALLRPEAPAAAPPAPPPGVPGAALPVVKVHRYRMSGHIRPLLFWISRDDVGDGRLAWRLGKDGAAGWDFVLGKYLGMAFTLTLLVALFAVALAGLLALTRAQNPEQYAAWDAAISKAVLLGWLEVMIVAAIAVFFSAFSSPYLSGVFTFALFFVGRTSGEIRTAAAHAKDPVIRAIAGVAFKVVPDLHVFAISGGEVAGRPVSVHADFVAWSYVGSAALYAALWVAILLILAMAIFRRKDFV